MTEAEFQSKVAGVLDDQRVTSAEPQMYAAHYTRATTPGLLLAPQPAGPPPNAIRQYDGDYMNDPEEGRYLVEVMLRAAERSTHIHKGLFVERLSGLRTTRLLYSAYQKATFLSCWTTTTIKGGREGESDSLNHWRFYGADGEGAGIFVPLSALLTVFPTNLYRVNYGIERRGGGRAAAQRPVRVIEDALKARFDSLRRTQSNALSDFEGVVRAIHPLLFLFKSDEYAAEQEVRSIVHKDNYATASGVALDERTPKRAFVLSQSGIISNGSIIYFGPKAQAANAIETMSYAASAGINVQVFLSTMPYR